MARKILIAYNGSERSRVALQEGVRQAKLSEAQVYLLAVVPVPPLIAVPDYGNSCTVEDNEQIALKATLGAALEEAHKFLESAGVQVTSYLKKGQPEIAIVEMAHALAVDMIILGHTRARHPLMRWLVGAIDDTAVAEVRCSVLVAADPPAAPSTLRSI